MGLGFINIYLLSEKMRNMVWPEKVKNDKKQLSCDVGYGKLYYLW